MDQTGTNFGQTPGVGPNEGKHSAGRDSKIEAGWGVAEGT